MIQYTDIIHEVLLNGEPRYTRTGNVVSKWKTNFEFDMSGGNFPILTTKKVNIELAIGELMWMLSGDTDLPSLRHYSDLPEGANTIWSADAKRWGGEDNVELGQIYGKQYRNYNRQGVDQIANLIRSLTESPMSRYHRVTAWNPVANNDDSLALAACHTDFQCFVSNDCKLSLHWNQRSCDVFLGLGYNISFYGAMLLILCQLTGYTPNKLSATILDTHIYSSHLDAISTLLSNDPLESPSMNIPEFKTLNDLLTLTAKDFKLQNYKHHGIIKAPLSVGWGKNNNEYIRNIKTY